MRVTATELTCVRAQGLYITEKCNGCTKLLNLTVRYTIRGRPEVYCSAVCLDVAFFGDRPEAKKHVSPGRGAYCGATLTGKRRGALYCGGSAECEQSDLRHGTCAQPPKPAIFASIRPQRFSASSWATV